MYAQITIRLERGITPVEVEFINEFTRTGSGPLSSTGIQASTFLTSEVAKARGQPDYWPDIQYVLLGTGVYGRQDQETSRSFNIKSGTVRQFYEQAKGKDSFQIMNMVKSSIHPRRSSTSKQRPSSFLAV